MGKRSSNPARFVFAVVSYASFFCTVTYGQIAKVPSNDGRTLFVNAEPPAALKIPSRRSAFLSAAPRQDFARATGQPASIYLSPQAPLTGKSHESLNLDRDGVEKLVREAAERHNVDPALVRAVIETESNWNPSAVSRKGAVGLMQLIPTTAQRFGVDDLYSPQQNVDAGVKYLRTLLERYNGNLDLALAAYNAGEGAVDRAHGVPSFRETRNYVQRVQSAYFRPGSGRLDGLFGSRRAIRKTSDPSGRTIFTND